MASLLLKPASEPADAWIAEFATLLPGLPVRVWPDSGEPSDVRYALVANMPYGELARFPNLKLIVSLPVGLDHLLSDPTLPRHVPMARCVNPDGDPMMTEFVLMHVLRHHRQLPEYAALQVQREWRKLPQPETRDRHVGVMGLGTFGGAAARALSLHGFAVSGWSRTRKSIEGVTCYAGVDEFLEFVSHTQILVCMLPTTSETTGILNARTFATLPRGASLINVARGNLLVESDLLDALNSGDLAASTLDVAAEEPLPADSMLWTHPQITITPHVASVVRARTAAPVVADNIRRLEVGEPLINPVDLDSGY